MRKGQRFTATKLANWASKGRGTGIFSEYQPWHQVTRGDPASRGRSQLLQWAHSNRSHHFLSDGESDAFAFISMLPGLLDVREQFPLSSEGHSHDIEAYRPSQFEKSMPGTLDCARKFGIRHPTLRGKGIATPWIMTTDFVVLLNTAAAGYELLAISVKQDADLDKPRTKELLKLEQTYWSEQGVTWLLLTPSLYRRRVGMTVRMALPWGLPKQARDMVSSGLLERCSELAAHLNGRSLTEVLSTVKMQFSVESSHAQQIFWQSVWSGDLKLDLDRSAFPSEPMRVLGTEDFWSQNPVAARRSLCF